MMWTYGAMFPDGVPLCVATKVRGKKVFVFLVQKPLLRRAEVFLVAWGFSVPCAGEPCDHHFLEFPIWWVRAQGFEP